MSRVEQPDEGLATLPEAGASRVEAPCNHRYPPCDGPSYILVDPEGVEACTSCWCRQHQYLDKSMEKVGLWSQQSVSVRCRREARDGLSMACAALDDECLQREWPLRCVTGGVGAR
jgi:hypothetical protein